MYVLYLDESGNESDPKDRHFVLAGLAVFESQIHFLSEALDRLQNKYLPGYEPIPMHASPMRKGRDFWRNVPAETRETMVGEIGDILSAADKRRVVLFAVAVEKSATLHGEDAVQLAVEEMCGRFNMFLSRLHKDGDTQRGFLVFAEGRFHQRARTWVKTFRRSGTKIGAIRNFAEDLPYSASANDSRLLQLADHIAHAVYLKFERNEDFLFRKLAGCFDQEEGKLHGLKHCRAVDRP
jgi:hypothetical protein